jgi:hypothetical protein
MNTKEDSMKTRIISAGWLFQLGQELAEDENHWLTAGNLLEEVQEKAPEGPDDETTRLLGEPLTERFKLPNDCLDAMDKGPVAYADVLVVISPERAEEYIIVPDALLGKLAEKLKMTAQQTYLSQVMLGIALNSPWIIPVDDQKEQWLKFEKDSGHLLGRLGGSWRKS